jgi:phage-related protein
LIITFEYNIFVIILRDHFKKRELYMSWKVEFYSTKVEDAILKWPVHLRAKFLKIVELIEKMGPNELGMPHIKSLKAGLFEIRVKSVEGIARAPFCMIKGKIVIVLSGFIKKTQEIPPRELEIAIRRMKEVKNNE